MFELEVGTRSLGLETLPAEAVSAFERTGQGITAFSLTPWKEHCTECAMPDCYSSCDLYAARRDGKCRRFVRGTEIIPFAGHPQGYVAKVAFKRWGQLMAYANARLIPLEEACAIERRVRRVEALAAALPGASIAVASRRGIPSRLASRWKQRVSDRAGWSLPGLPDGFLAEVFNPGLSVVGLSLSISNPGQPPFQERLLLRPGFQAVEVPVAAIQARVDLKRELRISLHPNLTRAEEEGLTLYFGLIAFIKRRTAPAQQDRTAEAAPEEATRPVKVAVWDLDQTLWSGTLLEDGHDGVRLREDAVAVIRELDRRGIVNSVLSKNHPEDALAALAHFGVDDYFVFPKIGWGEKGTNMKELVRAFNLDASAFAFIDDQAFERAQVVAANAGLRAYDSRHLLPLLELPEFHPPGSTESASRRRFYQAEERRGLAQESFGGEYLTFLRTCALRADIGRPDPGSFDRVHELVQRTNQLNYSGLHYSRAEIAALLEDPAHESFAVSCVDVYGEYGTVGFLVVDREQTCLRDAMFSCRIQFKRVEHAVLTFLLHRYRSRGAPHFHARFRETKRNAPAASVFEDLGFREVSRQGPDRLYRFDLSRPVPDEGIVTVSHEGVAWEPPGPSSVG